VHEITTDESASIAPELVSPLPVIIRALLLGSGQVDARQVKRSAVQTSGQRPGGLSRVPRQGCLVQACGRRTWTIQTVSSVEMSGVAPNGTHVAQAGMRPEGSPATIGRARSRRANSSCRHPASPHCRSLGRQACEWPPRHAGSSCSRRRRACRAGSRSFDRARLPAV